jgi:hypothetical protein
LKRSMPMTARIYSVSRQVAEQADSRLRDTRLSEGAVMFSNCSMRHSASECGWLILLMGAIPVGAFADSYLPMPNRLIPDPTGRIYVVQTRRGGDVQALPWGPVELTIAQRLAGTPPVIASRSKITEVMGKGYFIQSFPGQEIAVRKGDRILGRVRIDIPPGAVLVSSTGLGVVLLDIYGGNYTFFSRDDPALTIITLEGKILYRKTLQSLFTTEQIATFYRTGSNTAFWLQAAWIDEDRLEIVVVGRSGVEKIHDPIVVVKFNTGEARPGGRDEIVRAFQTMNAGAVGYALELAERWRITETIGPYIPKIFANPTLPVTARLRAAVYLGARGNERAAQFVKEMAIESSEKLPQHPDVDDAENERLFEIYSFAVNHLPDVLGEKALPVLREVSRKSGHGYLALDAYCRLGKIAERQLIEMLNYVRDPSEQVFAAEVLGRARANSERAIGALAKALQSKVRTQSGITLRSVAAFSLGEIGKAAKPAIPALRALTNDDDAEVRQAAIEAIKRIGD